MNDGQLRFIPSLHQRSHDVIARETPAQDDRIHAREGMAFQKLAPKLLLDWTVGGKGLPRLSPVEDEMLVRHGLAVSPLRLANTAHKLRSATQLRMVRRGIFLQV